MIVWDRFTPPKDRRPSKVPAPCSEIGLEQSSESCQLGNTLDYRLYCFAAIGALVTVWIEDDFQPIVKKLLLE